MQNLRTRVRSLSQALTTVAIGSLIMFSVTAPIQFY